MCTTAIHFHGFVVVIGFELYLVSGGLGLNISLAKKAMVVEHCRNGFNFHSIRLDPDSWLFYHRKRLRRVNNSTNCVVYQHFKKSSLLRMTFEPTKKKQRIRQGRN